MAEKTIRVKPRGTILPGIPDAGADVPEALALEWIRNGLVTRMDRPDLPAKEKK